MTLEQYLQWIQETFPDNSARAIAEANFRDALSTMGNFVFETNSTAFIQESISQATQAAITSAALRDQMQLIGSQIGQDKQATQAIKEEAAQLLANVSIGVFPLGEWDAAANLPAKTAVPPATIGSPAVPVPDDAFLNITKTGLATFDGTNFATGDSLGSGGKLFKKGNQWYYQRPADQALEKVLTLESKAPVTAASLLTVAIIDSSVNGWCIMGIMADGQTAFPPVKVKGVSKLQLTDDLKSGLIEAMAIPGASFVYKDPAGWTREIMSTKGVIFPAVEIVDIQYDKLSTDLKARVLSSMNVPGLGHGVFDQNGWLGFGIHKNGFVHPAQTSQPAATVAPAAAKTPWFNRYPNVMAKLPRFRRKLAGPLGATADDKALILLWGNSILAREWNTSILDVVPDSMPPGLTTKNFASYLFQGIDHLERPNYERYDKAGVFTFTGAWETLTANAIWDDSGDRPNETHVCTDAGAVVSFSIQTNFGRFNLVDRTATDGPVAVTIGVTAGAGILEVMLPGTNVWTEASGAVFSQKKTTSGARRGNTVYQRRIQFRKVGAGIGQAVAVTLTKDATAGKMMFWGVEKVSGTKPYYQVVNVARGGHTLAELYNYMDDDVIDRKPTLVVLEIPEINMIGTSKDPAYSVNWVWDVVWGDRPGFENTWSLKARSNNWTEFEVLLIMPHITRSHYNPDGSLIVHPTGYTAAEIYGAVDALIFDKGDLPMLDMRAIFKSWADVNAGGNMYTALTGSSLIGPTLTNDNTHQNDIGTAEMARHFVPALWLNTL